jgi:phosphatidylglycerophosphate synthase
VILHSYFFYSVVVVHGMKHEYETNNLTVLRSLLWAIFVVVQLLLPWSRIIICFLFLVVSILLTSGY